MRTTQLYLKVCFIKVLLDADCDLSGWKSAIINMNSFGKIVESVRFLSPDGRFLTSRVEAIKYMLKDGSASLDDMNRMRLGLLKDGWESDPKLPEGIFINISNLNII